MNHASSLIALAFALLATCLACNCKKISSKSYLDFPTDLSTDFHRNIAAALKKIVLNRSVASTDWYDDAIKQAKEEAVKETEAQVYSDVLRIGKGILDGRLLETFLSVCAQAENDPNSRLKQWKDFLKNRVVDRCSSSLGSTSEHGDWITRENTDIRLEMGWVFGAAFNMKGDIRDQERELEQKLSEFDPTSDKTFNAKDMIKEMRRITRDKSTGNDFDLFKNFMLGRCERLMAYEDLRKAITMMDLLRYLHGSIMVHNPPLSHLDEYNRLCLTLKKPDASILIRDNLNERLKPNWLGFLSSM